MFFGLGFMARREVKGAEDLLRKMVVQEYWKTVDFRWNDDAIYKRRPELRRHDMTQRAVLRGLALAETEGEFRKLLQTILNRIDDPKRLEYMKWLIDWKSPLDDGALIRKLEAKPFSGPITGCFLKAY